MYSKLSYYQTKKIFFLALTFYLLNFTIHAQKNYYVSNLGNDDHSGLSINNAWKTIQKAANTLKAGDTVFIRSGIYNEIVIPSNSGTKKQHITYTNYANETPVIDGSNFSDTYLKYSNRGIFDIKTKRYIDVIGLTIMNSNAGGIMCRYGSSDINIKNNTIKNCNATGIGVGYSRGNFPLTENIIVSGNDLDNCSTLSRESISLRSVKNFEIYNNTVTNTPKEAIDVKSGCSNGKIYNNKVSNSALGIYVDAGYKDSLYVSQNNIHIYQNIVKNCIGSFAVASEEECLAEDIWFYNNIAYDSISRPGNGFVIANYGKSGPLKNIYIINNTIYNKGHRGIYINNLNVKDIFIRNNIVSNNTISQIDVKSNLISGVTLKHNLIDGSNVDDGEFPVYGNPLFVDVTNGNFSLKKDSPAIDKGTAINAPKNDFNKFDRPIGDGYDIGCFEYQSTCTVNGQNKFIYYPNPTTRLIFIEAKNNIIKVDLFSARGQLLREIKNNEQRNKIRIDFSKFNYPRGLYFLRIHTNKGSFFKTVVLK